MRSVTFYLPDHPDPSVFDGVEPELDWRVFKTGRDQWIPFTYVCLRQAGHSVSIANEPPREGIAVVFASDMRRFLQDCGNRKDVLVVCTQADRRIPELLLADIVVQHNQVETDGRRTFFIPNWPQPGLIPRDPARGETLRVISYKGRILNLDEMFLSDAWDEFLAEHDMRFRIDTSDEERPPDITHLKAIEIDTSMVWNDFSNVDLVLAVRPRDPDFYPHKPALKLVNSWHARVPALLGVEHGYRELRRSALDYIEVSSLDDAMQAVLSLREDPLLYQRMIANGQARAADYSIESIRSIWEELLFDRLASWRPNRLMQVGRPFIAPFIRVARRVRRTLRR